VGWIAQQLGCAPNQVDLELVAGDASPRRYYRVTDSAVMLSNERQGGDSEAASLIGVISPSSENNEAFLYVGAKLAECGVRTPKVWSRNIESGWFLLEDFGDQLLLPLLSSSASASASASGLYGLSLDALAQLASIPCDDADIPRYDTQRLRSELAIFPEWFLSALLDIDVDDQARHRIEGLSEYLSVIFEEQPVVWVHRDFHSRNLMLLGDGDLGVIDFQDAVLGPVAYDPASLLKDCYIRWPRDQQLKWLDGYLKKLRSPRGITSPVNTPALSAAQASRRQTLAKQLENVKAAQFQRWFDLTGLQRHLRVLGVFARLHLRDHKSSYLADLPLVTEYVREALALTADSHSSVAEFRDWFESELMAVIRKQPWYKVIDSRGWAL